MPWNEVEGLAMRLIGNKTRLLPAIEACLRDRGIEQGTFIDIFTGTASVARHFKSRDFRVLANDNMSLCYTQAAAALEVNKYPRLRGFTDKFRACLEGPEFLASLSEWRESLVVESEDPPPAAAEPLVAAVHYLNQYVEPVEGLIYDSFSPGGAAGRRYFTESNARRIDAVLDVLRTGYRDGFLEQHELHLLLAALIDAADRVANISGTYGAFLKTWQSSARGELQLRVPTVTLSSRRHRAYQRDGNQLIRKLKGDVLYVDPPYNHRQYPANYHVLEVMAEHHKVDDLAAYADLLYGKTGLRPYGEQRSAFCVSRQSRRAVGNNAFTAMEDLILSARVPNVLISYNEEGVLSREELGVILARFEGAKSYDFAANMLEVPYRRFRSDADRPTADGKKRQYKVLDGRGKDELCEWLLFASRDRARRNARKAGRRAAVAYS